MSLSSWYLISLTCQVAQDLVTLVKKKKDLDLKNPCLNTLAGTFSEQVLSLAVTKRFK